VTAILAKRHNQDLRTFTIGFSERTHDESEWAKKVAEHCGTIHTKYTLDVSEALEIARNWGSLFDEPFGDASGIPTFLVSRLAGKEVKVVLSADGGDELFSGYKVYSRVLRRSRQLYRIPRWLGTALYSSTSKLLPLLADSTREEIEGARAMTGSSTGRIRRLRSLLKDPTAGGLLDASLTCWQPFEIARLIGEYESPRPSANSYPGPPATQLSLWDIQHYLPEDILTKVDRTTMAVSIEGREPLLDHRIVEYALSLPPHLRRGRLGPKHILKSILYRYVPRDLVDRPKQGFGIPLDNWLRTELKDLVTAYLDPVRIRSAGIMDASLVTETVKTFYEGQTILGRQLWYLLAFEMWRENWG
jgi:asparagine synthase (glutamine-hydrolysing)